MIWFALVPAYFLFLAILVWCFVKVVTNTFESWEFNYWKRQIRNSSITIYDVLRKHDEDIKELKKKSP